jgi:hypothetical protein
MTIEIMAIRRASASLRLSPLISARLAATVLHKNTPTGMKSRR